MTKSSGKFDVYVFADWVGLKEPAQVGVLSAHFAKAKKAGVIMSECRIEKISGPHHTFLTKRFDRDGTNRIHFASAMTMTGKTEDRIKSEPPSYLDLVAFIENQGVNVAANLKQLWRRIIFNIAISNTDDHLRNHGFMLSEKGWTLSPAYDLNPSIDKQGLSLNVDMDDNSLSMELAKSVGVFFRLNQSEMDLIIKEVLTAVASWESVAKDIGIKRSDIELMQAAFFQG